MNNDLISRQAAIDAFDLRDDAFLLVAIIKSKIKNLPPAQPALDEWCTDCKEYDHEHHCCPRWNRVIRTTLDDLQKEQAYMQGYEDARKALPSAQSEFPFEIQDILDYLDTVLHPIISPEHWNVYSELHDMISALPSAQPEITDEQAIEHLQSTGWMQSHDRILTERRTE